MQAFDHNNSIIKNLRKLRCKLVFLCLLDLREELGVEIAIVEIIYYSSPFTGDNGKAA